MSEQQAIPEQDWAVLSGADIYLLVQRHADDWRAVERMMMAWMEAKCATAKDAEIKRLRDACTKMNDEVCQVLGKVLGYPWFKDDPKNFPDATEADGVCVGDQVAESIADEAAARIQALEEQLARTQTDVTSAWTFVADMRFALGDRGARAQDELLVYCRELAAREAKNGP